MALHSFYHHIRLQTSKLAIRQLINSYIPPPRRGSNPHLRKRPRFASERRDVRDNELRSIDNESESTGNNACTFTFIYVCVFIMSKDLSWIFIRFFFSRPRHTCFFYYVERSMLDIYTFLFLQGATHMFHVLPPFIQYQCSVRGALLRLGRRTGGRTELGGT
jgi:hypothetical protein